MGTCTCPERHTSLLTDTQHLHAECACAHTGLRYVFMDTHTTALSACLTLGQVGTGPLAVCPAHNLLKMSTPVTVVVTRCKRCRPTPPPRRTKKAVCAFTLKSLQPGSDPFHPKDPFRSARGAERSRGGGVHPSTHFGCPLLDRAGRAQLSVTGFSPAGLTRGEV